MAGVQYDNVWKQFSAQAEDAAAVRGLSLDIDDRELLVLLGPSGCGKTTALRMLAGLEEPDRGDIRIDGKSVVGLEPKDRDVALVFQSYALYPHLSAQENIRYPLKVRRLSRTEQDRKVGRVAEMLGISHLLPRRPAQLSGGEQQRVALARAIVREPRVFLMDEPLSNLDAKLRVHTRTELKTLQRELGTTMVFVTHDQAEAMSLANRIAGQVSAPGTRAVTEAPDARGHAPPGQRVRGRVHRLAADESSVANARSRDVVAECVGRRRQCWGWGLPASAMRDDDGQLIVGLRPEGIEIVADAIRPRWSPSSRSAVRSSSMCAWAARR